MIGRISAGGVAWGWGNCLKCLKRGWKRKERRGNKNLKKRGGWVGGGAGSRGGCLKKEGAETPLRTMTKHTAKSKSRIVFKGMPIWIKTYWFIYRVIINCKFWFDISMICLFFLRLLFGFPKANFGPLSKGEPHSPDVNHCVVPNLDRRPPRTSWRGWVSKPSRAPSEPWTGCLPILSQRLNPLGHSPHL